MIPDNVRRHVQSLFVLCGVERPVAVGMGKSERISFQGGVSNRKMIVLLEDLWIDERRIVSKHVGPICCSCYARFIPAYRWLRNGESEGQQPNMASQYALDE